MASSSGTSSGSSSAQLQNSASSEEDLRALMKQRKQKRMLSNRESARRSRQRKQKHLDELMASVNHLQKEKAQILSAIAFTSQHHALLEADNSVLRTQAVELRSRLQSLDHILCFLNGIGTTAPSSDESYYAGFEASESCMRHHHPLVASAAADMLFHYS
uniref:BZIP domain-containing protein n=1 Tax=Ananas comosus var. bracteatus TaxID=296719 RepID=A0A6V7NX05_ANACO|nr:unnamed protein product [Ananas comosus var. bracteatus]